MLKAKYTSVYKLRHCDSRFELTIAKNGDLWHSYGLLSEEVAAW